MSTQHSRGLVKTRAPTYLQRHFLIPAMITQDLQVSPFSPKKRHTFTGETFSVEENIFRLQRRTRVVRLFTMLLASGLGSRQSWTNEKALHVTSYSCISRNCEYCEVHFHQN